MFDKIWCKECVCITCDKHLKCKEMCIKVCNDRQLPQPQDYCELKS